MSGREIHNRIFLTRKVGLAPYKILLYVNGQEVNQVSFNFLQAEEGRFLDIGCATGKLMEDMRGRGWQVQGVDLCRESAEYGWKKRKVKIFAGTLEQAAFQAKMAVSHCGSPYPFFNIHLEAAAPRRGIQGI